MVNVVMVDVGGVVGLLGGGGGGGGGGGAQQ